MVEMLVTHGVDIDAAMDSDLDIEKIQQTTNDATRALLEELGAITRLPARERRRALRLRAQLINAIVDADATSVRKVQQLAPELFERDLVTVELLHYAAWAGYGKVVDLLVELGAPMTIGVASALGRVELVTSMIHRLALATQQPEA